MTFSTHSLATAAQAPSGDSATSRTGSVHRTRILSRELVSREYMHTVPSSEPVIKKSF
jgi:hypothetical protein